MFKKLWSFLMLDTLGTYMPKLASDIKPDLFDEPPFSIVDEKENLQWGIVEESEKYLMIEVWASSLGLADVEYLESETKCDFVSADISGTRRVRCLMRWVDK